MVATVFIAAAAATVWLAASLLGWLLFTDLGLVILLGLGITVALSRLFSVLVILAGIIAIAGLNQTLGEWSALFADWWPLGLGMTAVVLLALLTERVFFRR